MVCSVLCVYCVMYGMLYVLYAHRVQYVVCVGIGYGVWYVVWYVWCVHCVFMVCSMFHVWYHTAYLCLSLLYVHSSFVIHPSDLTSTNL